MTLQPPTDRGRGVQDPPTGRDKQRSKVPLGHKGEAPGPGPGRVIRAGTSIQEAKAAWSIARV